MNRQEANATLHAFINNMAERSPANPREVPDAHEALAILTETTDAQKKADKARKAYAALDYFNDSAPNSRNNNEEYKEAQAHIESLYAVVKAYDPKTPVRFIMTITFYRIPAMGTGSARLIQYLNELAERHNVTIETQGDNDAEIYYLDRKNADAAMDELYKDNAGPRISSTGTKNDSAYQ